MQAKFLEHNGWWPDRSHYRLLDQPRMSSVLESKRYLQSLFERLLNQEQPSELRLT